MCCNGCRRAPVPPGIGDGVARGGDCRPLIALWQEYYRQLERFNSFGVCVPLNIDSNDAEGEVGSVDCRGLRGIGGVCHADGSVQSVGTCPDTFIGICGGTYRGSVTDTGTAGESVNSGKQVKVFHGYVESSGSVFDHKVTDVSGVSPVISAESKIYDEQRAGSVGSINGFRPVSVTGPNVERNRANRVAQKERRNRRKKLGQDWRKRDGGDMVSQDDVPGAFWNSTSNLVRQRLIDSKAEMHIAENERRTQEARDKIAYMKSPEATMRKAIGMIEFAEKQAKKENDSKVYGWAKTVATSSAESLARSTPDSVPSFDELSAKLAASSQSSFELELKAKQDEIDECKKELSRAIIEKEQESKRVSELELVKEQQVSKAKHDAVVNRMRQLELEKNKRGSAKTAYLDPNLAPSMKSSDQAYARKSYIKQFGFYPYDSK